MTPPPHKKVLLTGANGFIGSRIGAALASAGHRLICVKRKNSDLRRWTAWTDQTIWVDLETDSWRSQIIAARPEAVVHCAWAGTTEGGRNDWTIQTRNLDFFSEVLQTVAGLPIRRIIGLGSQAEYGTIHGRINEQAQPRPLTAYGAAKAAAATFLDTFARQNKLSHAWLRLFSVYGPGEGHQWLIPSLINQFLEGQPPQLTECEQRYDYLHVDDLTRGALAALAQPEHQGVFNLSSNTSVPLRTIVQLVRDLSGSRVVPEYGALPYRPGQSMHLEGDSSKFFKAFSFVPLIAMEEGIRDYVRQMQEERVAK